MDLRQLRLACGVLGLVAAGYLPVYGCSLHGLSSAASPEPFIAPARTHYTSATEPEPTGVHESTAAVRAEVLSQKPGARPDGRLVALARWAAEQRTLAGTSPSTLDVDRVSRRLGITAPFPMLLFVDLGASSWAEDLRRALDAQPRSTRHNQVGVHVDPSGLAVVALAANHATIAPVPRRVEPGQRVELKAELAAGWSRPEWLATAPDGKVRRLSATLEQPLENLEPGTHQIELLARGPFGLEVLANFPIGVGQEPVVESADLSGILWAPTAEAFLQAANHIRQRAGLPPLERDVALDRIADSHTRDMAQSRFFAHESPTRGSTHERMRRAGFPYQRYGENIGRARSPAEIHTLWLRSPGHRANLLDPGFTHIGLGVTTDGSTAPPVVIATQVFGGR
jgi:hypothetical protein